MGMQFDLFDTGSTDILSAGTYEEFKKRLLESECTRCELARTSKNIVIDRGNPNSRIMVIGDAPGEMEEKLGKAFVGRAGKLLDSIMDAVGLDTNRDMLIANIVKHRPPKNRVPRADEAEACMPYLKKQIELIAPRLIILLGATSLKYMDKSRKGFAMAEEAGKFFKLPQYPGIDFVVLYHTAALLRNPSLKKDMWAHVREMKRHIEHEGIIAERSE
jgi:DNA polymerase